MSRRHHGSYRRIEESKGVDPNRASLITMFRRASSTESRLSFAGDIARRGTASYIGIASQAYLETAVRDISGSDRQADIFMEADRLAGRALSMGVLGGSVADQFTSLYLRRLKSSIPMYASIFYGGVIPSYRAIQGYEDSLIKSIAEVNEVITNSNTDRWLAKRLSGLDGEIVTEALLNKYALDQIGDNSWLALPALMTEDRGTGHADRAVIGENKIEWDISVFTCLEGCKPERSYKVQVKSDNSPEALYEDDIAVVKPRLLRLDGEGPISWLSVSRELVVSRDGINDPSIGAKVEARTDLLLDILG